MTNPIAFMDGDQIVRMVLSAVPYLLLCAVFWVFIRLAWRCVTYPMEMRKLIQEEEMKQKEKKAK